MRSCSVGSSGISPVATTRTKPSLPFAVMGVSSLISYQRAKAESLGLDAKGGLMERAERVILLCGRTPLRPAAGTDPVDHARARHDHRSAAVHQGVKQAAVAPVTLARIEMRRSRRQSRRVTRADRRVRIQRRRPHP